MFPQSNLTYREGAKWACDESPSRLSPARNMTSKISKATHIPIQIKVIPLQARCGPEGG